MPNKSAAKSDVRALAKLDAGLHLLVGGNASGKSTLARGVAAEVAGSALLSAESQQAFYEAELRKDESDFQEATDHGTPVRVVLGEAAQAHPLFAALRMTALWERGYRQLSTGESRKVLLLHAVLEGPALLVLDDPFDGLDREAQSALSDAIVAIAASHAVLLVGALDAHALPVPDDAVRSVFVVERGALAFRGELTAWRQRAGEGARKLPEPPVDEGSFYPALDPAVPLVELHEGRVAYGDSVIFEGIELCVRPGEHTLIEGPNGSGKSTLLEMICGDHPQGYSNDLTLFGQKRGSGESVWDIKKNVGLLSPKLHRDYRVGGSVEDALVSGLFDSIGVYREREVSHRKRAARWLEWLDLGVAPHHDFRALSFGEQRMVLIARAAIKVPPLVVLDEPTSGLDPDHQARVLSLIGSLCTQQKSTVLFVTHRDAERRFWERSVAGKRLTLS